MSKISKIRSKKQEKKLELTISGELYELIVRYAELTGSSLDALPSELLEQQKVVFEELVKVFEIKTKQPHLNNQEDFDLLTDAVVSTSFSLMFDSDDPPHVYPGKKSKNYE